MSRIYQSKSEANFKGSAKGGSFNPVQATSDEKKLRQYKESIIQDSATKARQAQRQDQATNFQTSQQDAAARTQLDLENTSEQLELKLDQTYDTNVLKQEQLYEKGTLELEAKQQQLAANVQNAKTQAISTTINGLLSFGGSVLQYGQQMDKIRTEEAEKQAFIDSGAWAFTSDYDASLGGESVIQQEQNQLAIENFDEQSIVDAAPGNPIEQERLRTASGINQTTNRQMSQVSVGQAASLVGGRLTDAFYDPNTRVRLPSGELVSPLAITDPGDLVYAIRALAQGVTAELGVASGDRYTAVKQYVPKLEAAMRQLESQNMSRAIAAGQSNRESTGYTNAGQLLSNTGDVTSAWQQFYSAAWASGKYGGDKAKATKAAFEAFTATASRGDLESLRGVPVYPGGPTFGADKRFANQIDDAIDAIDRGLITDYNTQKGLQTIELSNATNSYTEALINAQTPEQTLQANQAYEAQLAELAAGGNAQARKELIKQQGIQDNYNPQNANSIREQIAEGQTFSEEFLKSELASGRINSQEYTSLKQSGLATPENKAKVYGGKEAYSGLNSGVKSQVSRALDEQLGGLESDIRQGYVSSIAQDIIKRRDAAVNSFIKQAPDASPGDVQAFAERWTQQNIPNLVANVKLDKSTGSLTGYTRMGQSETPQAATAANGYKGLPSFSNPYTKRTGVDYSSLSNVQLRNVGASQKLSYIDNKVLTTNERTAAIKAYTTGGNYPPSVLGKAQALGITPDNLVKLQAAGAGFKLGERPTQDLPEVQEISGSGPTNMESGYRALKAMGFPPRGAAYLAGNIQQESGWNGMRDWGQVMGDGTSRNGGLVSWASWSNDPARLGAIESYLGKNIKTATHAEQLQAMMWEMKNQYSGAYRVFMNPNATDAQLRRASKDYWGYGHEGSRFAYARRLQ